jgi:hypothetical protein
MIIPPGLNKEIQRIIEDVAGADATSEDRAMIAKQLMLSFVLSSGTGVKARIHRMTYEILYKYYCICEGLDKGKS